MLQDVIFSAKNAPGIDQIMVVTPKGPAATIAREQGAKLLLESQTDGLNKAVQIAVTHAQTREYERLLIVHADLPLIQAQDLSLFFQGNSKIIISPSRDLDGTNALLLSPPGIIRPRYGRRSFEIHKTLAHEAGIEADLIENARLSLDIDTPEDLMHLCGLHPGGHTGAFLEKHKIRERVDIVHQGSPGIPEIEQPFH